VTAVNGSWNVVENRPVRPALVHGLSVKDRGYAMLMPWPKLIGLAVSTTLAALVLGFITPPDTARIILGIFCAAVVAALWAYIAMLNRDKSGPARETPRGTPLGKAQRGGDCKLM
jgi:hypothetical protein